MIRYGELEQAVMVYTQDDAYDKIPVDYYRQVMKLAVAMNNAGKHLDVQQSAAILLHLAFRDECLQYAQLTGSGIDALDYAEKLLLDNGLSTERIDDVSQVSFRLIS